MVPFSPFGWFGYVLTRRLKAGNTAYIEGWIQIRTHSIVYQVRHAQCTEDRTQWFSEDYRYLILSSQSGTGDCKNIYQPVITSIGHGLVRCNLPMNRAHP